MPQNVTTVNLPDLAEKFRNIKVDKLHDLDFDLGSLLAVDRNILDYKEFSRNKDAYLLNLARDNTQLLLNSIWTLPTDRVEEAIVATLPEPTTVLPREKPIPKPKPLTKWQQYAKEKGIKTTKKAKLTWDEVLKQWVPRHGYKRAAAQKEKDWVVEIPDQADPYKDYFQEKTEQKKEKIAKNEFQRLRNIARAKNVKVPSMGLPPTDKLTSIQLNTAAHIANVSTASFGKFQPKLSKEKTLNKSSMLVQKKRKHQPVSEEQEKRKYLDIADSLLNKRPKLDIDKLVNSRDPEQSQTQGAQDGKNKKKAGKKGGKKRTTFTGSKKKKGGFKGDKRPPAGKGQRTQKGGRKRR